MSKFFALMVEGGLDEAVGRRLIASVGGDVVKVYGRKGFGYIKSKLPSFAAGFRGMPLLVLVDLMDTGLDCAPSVLREWLPHGGGACTTFRVVVREIESWLLADRQGIAHLLGVSLDNVPRDPEALLDPKRELVQLATRARRSDLRRLLVPRVGSSAAEGPGYTSTLREFALHRWNLEVAVEGSPSLARCVNALQRAV